MRNVKWALASLLTLIMLLGPVGPCRLIKKPSESRAEAGSEAVEAPKDIWAPYEKEVVITTMGEENSGTAFQGDDNYQKNPWYQAYKDRFHIALKNKWISNDYNTKLNLSIADGDIADVFYVDSSRLTTLYNAGMIMNLDDLFERYASDRLKSYWKENKDTWQTGCFDSSLYGIPQMNYGIIDQFKYIWIRQDWMKECGFSEPKSMDDVIKIATTFAQKYGGYGLAENQNLDIFYKFALSWGGNPGIWVKQEDGQLGYGNIQPQIKEALAQYAKWYKEGIINHSFATMDSDKMFQDMINGSCGVIAFDHWFCYNPMPDLLRNQGTDAIFYPYEIPTKDGSPVKASIPFNNSGYVVISNSCKNPEAAMKIINFFCYMMDDAVEGGESADFIYSLYDNNYPNIVRGTRVINPDTDYKQFIQVKDAVDDYLAKKKVDTDKLGKNVSKYNSCINWIEKKDIAGVGDWIQQGNDRSTYGIAKKYVDNEQYVKDAMWGAATPTLQAAGSTLNDILTEGFTKIIIGEKPIDYFDTVVEKWKKAGGQKVTEEINRTYNH